MTTRAASLLTNTIVELAAILQAVAHWLGAPAYQVCDLRIILNMSVTFSPRRCSMRTARVNGLRRTENHHAAVLRPRPAGSMGMSSPLGRGTRRSSKY